MTNYSLRTILLVNLVILAFGTLPTTLPRLRLLVRHFSTKMSAPTYADELLIAQLAVQRAAILTKSVFNTTLKGTLQKSDHSPVTVGDFGAQALIISALRHNFPSDEIVAEEEAADLRENEGLREQVWRYVKGTKLDDRESEGKLGGAIKSVDEMMDVIDGGRSAGGNKGRIWAIDPIDGTKGFLRGGQYAVCLALMVDGHVKVGVLGCPNLPTDDSARIDNSLGADQKDEEGKGVLISAAEGQGATSRPLSTKALIASKKIMMKPIQDLSQASFCEGVEAAHSNQSQQAAIAKRLGIVQESVRMDSQCKYASIARGAGDIYLRLQVKKDYQEKIWDHAAGVVIVREAGGEVLDSHEKPLDFSIGRTLRDNTGVVAAPKAVIGRVVEAVKEVIEGK